MAIARNAALVGSSLLMLIGIIWSIAAVASPAWQVVNLREYQTEHEHGLWQDCARTVKTGTYQGTMYDNQGALHCTYKFDYSPGQLVDANDLYVDENSAAGETRYHQFYAFHVVFLILIGASVFAGIIAICVSCGAPRYPSCAIVFTILSFVCLVLTFAVVSSFFIIAHRVDNRFVKGIVGTYEAVIGRAYYFELVSCIFYLLAFICSLLTSYLFLQAGDSDGRRRVIQRGAPLLDYPPNYVKVQGPPTTGSYPPGPGSFRGFESNV